MIQGFNPRTGERTGKPVAETTDAEVDAAVQAAAAALPEWAGLGGEERARAAGGGRRTRWTPGSASWWRWRTRRRRWGRPG